jgi:chromosome segregation ATPase
MVGPEDMSTPVTRSELREEIQRLDDRIDRLDQKLEQRFAQMATKADLAQMATKADLAQMATKADLDQRFAQMVTKADLDQRLAQMATKADLEIWGGALLERLLTELARHTKASQEALAAQISAIDDKYADVPARLNRLETAVFGAPQR